MVRGIRIASAGLAALALSAPAGAEARTRPPELTRLRCVPATTASCRGGISVAIGRQLQFSGRRIYKGALATKLDRTRAGYVARVPPGTRAGTVSVTVSDRAGRRSNVIHIRVIAPPRFGGPLAARGSLPAPFAGAGMWIWQLPKSESGDVAAIAARAHAAGIGTVFVKSSDGAANTMGDQFSLALVQQLHAQGLKVCAWAYVYGNDPLGEASLAAAAVANGADCFVIDAESEYEGRYAAAQQYMSALRAGVGPGYPIGLTSFPYIDYHARLPYSVFLGPGGAQVNLPQVYWRAIGGTVDAVSAHTMAHNRIYGAAIAPLGQSYGDTPPEEIDRFRSIWATYGSGGLSWWSWQATTERGWAALALPPTPIEPLPDPGWPALAKGNKGDEVVWLQQHLASADPAVQVTSTFDAATDTALRNLQAARGLAVTGATDPLTWQAVLSLAIQPHDWTMGS
jgi:hypothetical protein